MEMLETKNKASEMKNSSTWLISRLDRAEERNQETLASILAAQSLKSKKHQNG